jgi:hypothetical protein
MCGVARTSAPERTTPVLVAGVLYYFFVFFIHLADDYPVEKKGADDKDKFKCLFHVSQTGRNGSSILV